MPSNKETLFQDHICDYLENTHKYVPVETSSLKDKEYHFIEKDLIAFIQATQKNKYTELQENFGTDTDKTILNSLKDETHKKPLWLIMRDKLNVKGVEFELYKPKPRSNTSKEQEANYEQNIFSFKDEYYYHSRTEERIDLAIWLNGLPIIIMELKHEDEGQNVDDAIYDSFLNRDRENNLYKLPFLYIASSNVEVKVSTNPASEKHFMWFNASLMNESDTEGEYPVEHLYRDALSRESIVGYLESFLIFIPTVDKIDENGEVHTTKSFTIFPRYHQLRATRNLSENINDHINTNRTLSKKYLINHSAGSGKTLTIAWMADLLDSLYTNDNQKVFDNIIILTDRKSLDKNIRDDLEKFSHLSTKVNFAKKSTQLADFLDKDKDIIVSTIHKFGYIQEKIEKSEKLKNRKVAFLIDEAHRSQDGKMSHTLKNLFIKGAKEIVESGEDAEDEITDKLNKIDMSNQVFVAFTATTTPKTVAYFGEPFDIYSEEEAIKEGYILDVASNIISYETLYHLKAKGSLPDTEFPSGVISKALRNIAFNDNDLIQYKSEVIVKMFVEKVANSIDGKSKAMVIASSRPAGLKYFQNLKTIFEEKKLPYKVLFAFSDYSDPINGESIEEIKINELDTLHKNKVIEDVFELDEYRILVVANKFQTGFNQPLLSAMFLDKSVNGVNAIQTVSRLNRKHIDKEQDDILVVDFTNNSKEIFNAFNKHRQGSPYTEEEPSVEVLEKIYEEINEFNVFTLSEITAYVEEWIEVEIEARKRNSTNDAILSNTNQKYKAIFEAKITNMEDRKKYVSLLNRYIKHYYFIAQFFELGKELNDFVVFAETIGQRFLAKGKGSELIRFLQKVELSKGAVKFIGNTENSNEKPKTKKSGGGRGGREIPKSTIEAALENIIEKYQINKDEAIIIKEICEEVSEQEEIKTKVVQNKDNEMFLQQFEPNEIQQQIKNGYMTRDMWDTLENDIYIGKGGIISLMGKTVVNYIISMAA